MQEDTKEAFEEEFKEKVHPLLDDVGAVKALAKEENPRIKRWRPAPGSVSIGHYKITASTLVAAVTDKKTGDLLILSNNYVLANSNEGKIRDSLLISLRPIVQQSPHNI